MPNFKQPLVTRQKFDPTNEAHMLSFKQFLRTGNWGDVQFYPELPYIEVPMTVMMRYAEHVTGVKRETTEERGARFAKIPNLIPMPTIDSPKAARAKSVESMAQSNRLHQARLNAPARD